MIIQGEKELLREYTLRLKMEEISVGRGVPPHWKVTLKRYTHDEIITIVSVDKFATMAIEKALDEYNDKVPVEEIIL